MSRASRYLDHRMISYSLRCADDHRFESWFKSSQAFDSLLAAGHVACAVCGSPEVTKVLMSPRVSTSEAPAAPARPLSGPAHPAEQTLRELKKKIEESSDYVGDGFAREARAIHVGDAPDRPIYGEAHPREAKALLEDGIPVVPLPFRPERKSN